METRSTQEWAEETFGRANLGDPRRTRRLVSMAAAAASRPGATVTATQGSSAEREGAFRFLENKAIKSAAVSKAIYESTGLACGDEEAVFVAIDQMVHSVADRKGIKGLGPSHNRQSTKSRTIHWMNSLVIDSEGTPMGLIDQQAWIRGEDFKPHINDDERPSDERESWKWVEALKASESQFEEAMARCRRWYVMDRGADCHSVWSLVAERKLSVTIRSCYKRVIRRNGREQRLNTTLARQRVIESFELRVSGNEHRKARVANFEVRVLRAPVRLRSSKYGEELWIDATAVEVREKGTTPTGEDPILWRLLSTVQAETKADVLKIIRSYTLRWRVEEFHKTWKSGACDLENVQLRSFQAIYRWATLLAAVAVRVERLKRLSREQPELDALEELSREEIDAAIILTKTKKYELGACLTLEEAVRLIAIVGGHMGSPSYGPPGTITIRRGMDHVVPAAIALARVRTSD